jgi:hypothetical protein
MTDTTVTVEKEQLEEELAVFDARLGEIKKMTKEIRTKRAPIAAKLAKIKRFNDQRAADVKFVYSMDACIRLGPRFSMF